MPTKKAAVQTGLLLAAFGLLAQASPARGAELKAPPKIQFIPDKTAPTISNVDAALSELASSGEEGYGSDAHAWLRNRAGDSFVRAHLQKVMNSQKRSPAVRLEAARFLAGVKGSSDRKDVRDANLYLLESPDVSSLDKSAAILALERGGYGQDPKTYKALLALADRERDTDPDLAMRAADSLLSLKPPALTAILRGPSLDGSDSNRGRGLLDMMKGHVPDAELKKRFNQALARFAASGGQDGDAVRRHLLDAAKTESDLDARLAAVESLGDAAAYSGEVKKNLLDLASGRWGASVDEREQALKSLGGAQKSPGFGRDLAGVAEALMRERGEDAAYLRDSLFELAAQLPEAGRENFLASTRRLAGEVEDPESRETWLASVEKEQAR